LKVNQVCAVVTTFDPDELFNDRLNNTFEQVGLVIVVNDSGSLLGFNISKSDKITLINNERNIGIASSLNVGIEKAIALGYKYIITLDDDTMLCSDYVKLLYEFMLNDHTVALSIGSFSHSNTTDDTPFKSNAVITSGAMVKSKSFIDVNGFADEMFIDYVDFDFCLKLRTLVGDIWTVPQAKFSHTIGEKKEIRFFGFYLSSFNHQPFRIYYQARNTVYLFKKHFFKYPIYMLYILRNVVTLQLRVLFIDTNKIKKFKLLYKGLVDALCSKYGKYLD
jgi:rhamnosyltransferase